jgi:hypothetical protein
MHAGAADAACAPASRTELVLRNPGIGIGVAIGIDHGMPADSSLESDPDAGCKGYTGQVRDDSRMVRELLA